MRNLTDSRAEPVKQASAARISSNSMKIAYLFAFCALADIAV
jgi:hypothetical protein